jgi:hypothetical protein
MASLSSILSGVYDYLGRPTQDKLSLSLVLPFLLDCINFYTVDMQLSSENWLLKSATWTPASKEENIANVASISDYSVPVAVEIRDAASTDEADWEGILIASVSDIQDISRDGTKAVAFFGNPPQLKWSINPDDFEFEAKLWYEPMAAEPSALSESPNISQAFHAMLKLRTALLCLPHTGIANPEQLTTTLATQLAQWEKKWIQWVNIDRNAKQVIKRDFRGARKQWQW